MSRQERGNRSDAVERLSFAREQLQLAEVGAPWESPASRKASGACAVLAAVAAADAVCWARLGVRPRGPDHRDAVRLLAQVVPDGASLARDLENALAVKDLVHYGAALLSPDRHRGLLRSVERLIAAAQVAVTRQ